MNYAETWMCRFSDMQLFNFEYVYYVQVVSYNVRLHFQLLQKKLSNLVKPYSIVNKYSSPSVSKV